MFYSIISQTNTKTHKQYIVRIGFNASRGYRTKLILISYDKGYEWMAFPIYKSEVDYSVELAQVRYKANFKDILNLVFSHYLR